MDGDVDFGEAAAKGIEDGQQVEAGVFVGGEQESAAVKGAELFDGRGSFAAHGEQACGVVAEEFAGSGEGTVAGCALEEDFADGVFELADYHADGGLGTVEADGGAGEAALFGNGEEGFEVAEFHGLLPPASITNTYR